MFNARMTFVSSTTARANGLSSIIVIITLSSISSPIIYFNI